MESSSTLHWPCISLGKPILGDGHGKTESCGEHKHVFWIPFLSSWFPRVPLWIICYPRIKCPSWSVPIVWGVQTGLFILLSRPPGPRSLRSSFCLGRYTLMSLSFLWALVALCALAVKGGELWYGGSINGGTLYEWMVYFTEKLRIPLMKPGATMTYRKIPYNDLKNK